MRFWTEYWTYGFYYPAQLAHCTCQVPPETETRAVSASVFTAPKQRQGFVRKPLSNTIPFVVDPFSFLKPKYLFSSFRDQDSGVNYANINAQDPSRQWVESLLVTHFAAHWCTRMRTMSTSGVFKPQRMDEWLGSGMWGVWHIKTSNCCCYLVFKTS